MGKEKDFARLDKFIEVLAKELVSFMGADVQLKFDLAPLKVSQKKINPLGIILNELITNSLKHAFEASQKDKTISISLEKEGGLGKLTYRDNGKGLPENSGENTKSLGLKLIHNLVLQLDGSVENHAGKGAFFEIRFVL
jgi:two-component sensor histidine kinase